MTARALQAVLWDMDGTLVDSEPVWARIQIEVISSLGGRWTIEQCEALVGSALPDALGTWMTALPAGVISPDALGDRIYGDVVRAFKEGVEFRPGALELLAALRAEGVPCALASASYRAMVLEDSPSGAASGNAAGALVVAVPQLVTIPPAPRRIEVESLSRLTPARLRELVNG